jgi:hypothetical protein
MDMPGSDIISGVTGAISEGIQSVGIPISAFIVAVDPPFITIPCQYNPSEIKFKKSTNWSKWKDDGAKQVGKRNVPRSYFKSGEAPSLSMTLYFDTSEEAHMDVRFYTDLLVALTLINPLNKLVYGEVRPSQCKFIWGMFSVSLTMAFTAYIPSVDLKFTHFLSDGTPVRAEADVEFIAVSSMLPMQNPTSRSEARSVRVVTEGQTIDLIAHQEYGDPAAWRHIAKVNGLTDPRNLKAGQVLRLTPLPADYKRA